jgi:hypothetical protein
MRSPGPALPPGPQLSQCGVLGEPRLEDPQGRELARGHPAMKHAPQRLRWGRDRFEMWGVEGRKWGVLFPAGSLAEGEGSGLIAT